MSRPYSGAIRRVPPPGMTIACALDARVRSSGRSSPTRETSQPDMTGSDNSSSDNTPSHASRLPTRSCLYASSSPNTAQISGPAGGSAKLAITFRNTIQSHMLCPITPPRLLEKHKRQVAGSARTEAFPGQAGLFGSRIEPDRGTAGSFSTWKTLRRAPALGLRPGGATLRPASAAVYPVDPRKRR